MVKETDDFTWFYIVVVTLVGISLYMVSFRIIKQYCSSPDQLRDQYEVYNDNNNNNNNIDNNS